MLIFCLPARPSAPAATPSPLSPFSRLPSFLVPSCSVRLVPRLRLRRAACRASLRAGVSRCGRSPRSLVRAPPALGRFPPCPFGVRLVRGLRYAPRRPRLRSLRSPAPYGRLPAGAGVALRRFPRWGRGCWWRRSAPARKRLGCGVVVTGGVVRLVFLPRSSSVSGRALRSRALRGVRRVCWRLAPLGCLHPKL